MRVTLHNFLLFHLGDISKTRASCFITRSKHLETIKPSGIRPSGFHYFLVWVGTFDITLAFVFDILHNTLINALNELYSRQTTGTCFFLILLIKYRENGLTV